MDEQLEKEYALFQEALKGVAPGEKAPIYSRWIEELELRLRESKLRYERAKALQEAVEDAEIILSHDELALLIDKLRFERDGLEIDKATETPLVSAVTHVVASSIHSSKPIPASTVPLFSKPPDRKKLTVEQAAEYIGVKKQTMYQWCSEKKVTYRKIGRKTFFDADELDAWVAKGRVKSISDAAAERWGKKPLRK